VTSEWVKAETFGEAAIEDRHRRRKCVAGTRRGREHGDGPLGMRMAFERGSTSCEIRLWTQTATQVLSGDERGRK
jgi:hypothetical protein